MAVHLARISKRAIVRRSLIVLAGLSSVIISAHDIKAQTQGQSQQGHRTKRIKLVPRGLPETAKVNSTMFQGIELSAEQGAAIAHLGEKFSKEDAKREAKNPIVKPLDRAAKLKLAPIFEKQRLAYRAVLTSPQQRVFDSNTKQILEAWLNAPHSTTNR